MIPSFTNQVVGCDFTHQIWAKIEKFFASQTKARTKQLKIQLKAVKKEEVTHEYLLKVKKIIDVLATIGAPASTDEHIVAILDG